MYIAEAKWFHESLTPRVSVRDIYHPLDAVQLNPLPRFREAPTHEPESTFYQKRWGCHTFAFPSSLAAREWEHEWGSGNEILPLQTWQEKLAKKAEGIPLTLFWWRWWQLAEAAVRADRVAVSCNQCWWCKPWYLHLPSSGSNSILVGNVW